MKTLILLGLVSLMGLAACSNGGGTASPKPPLSEDVIAQYGGQKFSYTSPDGTATSNVELYQGDNSQMTVQDSGPSPVLFGETFTMDCTNDRTCSAYLSKYDADVKLSLDSETSVTFTVRNRVEQVDDVVTYTALQQR